MGHRTITLVDATSSAEGLDNQDWVGLYVVT